MDAVRIRVREALVGSPQVAELASARSVPGPAFTGGFGGRSTAAPSPLLPGLQRTLDGAVEVRAPSAVPAAGGHPRLQLLGCLHALYWVAESDEVLVLIDQHAANERVV